MATQSYFGMPMPSTGTSPTQLNQSQTAASTGTSSSPLQSSLPTTTADSTSGRSLATQQTQDYGGGNPYLTGLNYPSQPTMQSSGGLSPGQAGYDNPVSFEQLEAANAAWRNSGPYAATNPAFSQMPGGLQSAPQTTAPPPAAAPVQPQSSIPSGGTLQPVQTQAAAQTAGTSNIFGNATPPTLANIPGIRQMPNGQWSDGQGKLYNPQTGAVAYDPGGPGSVGAGLFQPGDTLRNQGQLPAYQPTPYVQPTPGVTTSTDSTSGRSLATQGATQPQTTQAVANVAQARAATPPSSTWNIDPNTGMPEGVDPTWTQGQGWAYPTTPTTPTTGGPATGNPSGVPNSYNPFTNNTYPPNTTNPINFSGNNGPRPYATGQVPSGFGQQPSLSPQFTEGYFNWLYNQMGQGASPYGQQQTFLPGQGGSSMQGLTAPETQLAQQARQGIQDFTGYIGGMIDPARLESLRGEYGPLSQVGQSFAQTGGYGFPGQELGLQAQYGARGNSQDPTGMYTGAQALQGAASGVGTPGLPGQYLNSAMQYGGMGLPADIQSLFAQYGAGPGTGGSTLNSMAQTGNPTDVGPAWEAMKAAQQRNIDQNAAQIRERMGLSGNLGLTGGGEATASTPYHTALTDFYTQTARDQNANLTQASQQAQEAARSRMLGAAGTMSGQQLGAAQNLGGLQQQAGLFGAGQQNQTSQYLQNLMSQGVNQLGQNQLGGAGLASGIVNQSQQTPYNIYGNLLGMQQGNLSNMANLGQQYQGQDQAAINRQYQEYLRTRPEYNPLLQQMYGGATTFPGVYSQQFGSGVIPGLIGQGLGFLGNMFGTP